MVAGPNGAGKTTTALALLSPQQEIYDEFLNADEIARGLSPLHPASVNREAGKLMIKRFHSCIIENKSFIFETTASGLSYANHLKNAKKMGYRVDLLFLWLLNYEQAVKRVAQRVKQGGHNIPKEDIIRRYARGLKNLVAHYLPIVDSALILDNSEPEAGTKKVIVRKEHGDRLVIEDKEIWGKILEDVHGKI
jgi:predicted ABC-type ATPase